MKIIPLHKWLVSPKRPLVIAGPCSAESQEQVLGLARTLANMEEVSVFRAGIWKPRTRPDSFEGLGEEALPWLAQVKKETGLLTACEVANARHTELALKYGIDILWIGARTTVSPFAVQEIADALAGTSTPVMVKNPINLDLSLWLGAFERLEKAGLHKLVAVHRGFSTGAPSKYRNPPHWGIPLALKQKLPELPIICDPSHITGRRDLVARICQKAMDVDMDGLMIETHSQPDLAWSDAAQQVTPERLQQILSQLELRTEFSHDRSFEQELEELRSRIDRVDREIIESLGHRMEVVKEITAAKMRNNITAFQLSRLDQMLKERLEWAKRYELESSYIEDLYHIIHGESVKKQTSLMANFRQENHEGRDDFRAH